MKSRPTFAKKTQFRPIYCREKKFDIHILHSIFKQVQGGIFQQKYSVLCYQCPFQNFQKFRQSLTKYLCQTPPPTIKVGKCEVQDPYDKI